MSFYFNEEEEKKINELIESVEGFEDLSWYRKVIIPRILKNKSRYLNIAESLGLPYAFIPLIEIREMGPHLGKFTRYLGNGQKLSQKTTIVPKGRGPFESWEAGVIDAIKHEKLDEIRDWSLARVLFELESYNGFGYKYRGKLSPYVWSKTRKHGEGTGLFVSDGKYSSTAKDKNIGAYAFYTLLIEADPDFMVAEEIDLPVMEEKSSTWNTFLQFMLKWLSDLFLHLSKNVGSPKHEKRD